MQGAGYWQQKPVFTGIDVQPLPPLPPPGHRILDAAAFASNDSLAAARAEPGLWWFQQENITDPDTRTSLHHGSEDANPPEVGIE
jgi:hypothetical protein